MQARWYACLQAPQTTGQSSPGNLTPGAQPSKGDWQIPQTSSAGVPQDHRAMPWKDFTFTLRGFFVEEEESEVGLVLEVGTGEPRSLFVVGIIESNNEECRWVYLRLNGQLEAYLGNKFKSVG